MTVATLVDIEDAHAASRHDSIIQYANTPLNAGSLLRCPFLVSVSESIPSIIHSCHLFLHLLFFSQALLFSPFAHPTNSIISDATFSKPPSYYPTDSKSICSHPKTYPHNFAYTAPHIYPVFPPRFWWWCIFWSRRLWGYGLLWHIRISLTRSSLGWRNWRAEGAKSLAEWVEEVGSFGGLEGREGSW